MSDAPPPVQSPKPDYVPPTKTPTGEHPVVKKEMKKALRNNEIKTIVSIVVASLGVLLGGWRVVLGEARAQADAGVAQIEARVRVVEKQQDAVMTELRETRQDIKELYKSMRYDRTSPRLENPLSSPDGGLQ